MVESVWVRVSPASLGSQSWVGHHQGQAGEVRGGGAKNWCVGEGMEILKKWFRSPRELRERVVDHARTCHFQGSHIFK